ncbi:MAG TPA: ATP-binding protein [Candidatus Mediterraneibacter cottocaccae]|nr:ATP-binding protein [Candidatus Mediterraneibacter cottocaccae]
MKPVTTGTEDFREFLTGNFYYIDKTDFIETVFHEKVSLFTRPRRFGKTLNMSMLYYFFSNKEQESARLFDGMKISKNTEIMRHQNQYPVIFLTLKDMKNPDFKQQTDYFSFLIAREVRNHEELFDSPHLLSSEKETLKRYDFRQADLIDLQNALLNLCTCLEKHYQKKVILLIDEYDVPLQSAFLNGYYNEMSHFISAVFSSALKTNPSLERGVLTGCLRIAKESIFTGLNNFSVYSIFNKDASSRHFGFTDGEVDRILADYHLTEYKDRTAEWYDGYLFGNEEIYNPWSVLNYVKQIVYGNDPQPRSYWANTSSNDIVYNYIKTGTYEMKQTFEALVQGHAVTEHIAEELTYREMDDTENVYSFMLFTGYLKIKEAVCGADGEPLPGVYRLVIPNKEVQIIFENQFQKYFTDYVRDKKGLFLDDLKEGRVDHANLLLNDILFNSVSFYDNYEAFYHGFMTGLFAGYPVESNMESGEGRFDIAVLSPNPFGTNVVIECKKSKERKDLKEDSRKAARQITEKKYVEGLQARGYDIVRGYGIAFYGKGCYITAAE